MQNNYSLVFLPISVLVSFSFRDCHFTVFLPSLHMIELTVAWDSPAVFLTFLFLAGTGYLLSFTSCVSLFLEGEFARHRRNAWQSTTFHSSFLHWFHSCWWVLSCWWINLSLVLSFSCLNIGLGLEDQRTTIPFKDRASSKKCLPEKKKTAADSSSLIREFIAVTCGFIFCDER